MKKFKFFSRFLNMDAGRQGFTMIELMVVMAVIVVFSIYGAANYKTGNSRVALELSASHVAQNMRKVQSWALSAHQVSGLETTMLGYGIHFSSASSLSSYDIYIDIKGAGAGYFDVTDSIVENVSLGKDVEIDSVNPDPLSINLFPPDPITKIANPGNPLLNYDEAVVTLRLIKNPSVKKSVHMNKAGLIYVSD